MHRLGDRPVAGVPRVMPGPLVRLIPQVRGHLGLQRPLQHRPHQLPEHRPLTRQPQLPRLVLGPCQQQIQRPVTDQLADRHLPARTRLFRPPAVTIPPPRPPPAAPPPPARPGLSRPPAVTIPQPRKTGITADHRHDDGSPPEEAGFPRTSHNYPESLLTHLKGYPPGGSAVRGTGPCDTGGGVRTAQVTGLFDLSPSSGTVPRDT